jgi:hypothetical protein
MKHIKLKELLLARKKASSNMKQISSVCSYYSDALEQAKQTGFQYDIDHARDRYTKYFDNYFYDASDRQRKANLAVIKCVDEIKKQLDLWKG